MSVEPLHVAMVAIPAHGHVNPMLGLVAELTRRGHRVTFAVTREFAPLVEEAGASLVAFESKLPSAREKQPWPTGMRDMLSLFVDDTIAVLPQLERIYEHDRPDVIVYDTGAAHAAVLGEKLGVPHLPFAPSHVELDSSDVEYPPEVVEVFARYDEFFRAEGVDLTLAALEKPSRCLVALPRGFQHRSADLVGGHDFVGPMLTDRAAQGEWTRPDERPVLLISLGSVFNDRSDFYRRCLEAFGGSGWHVVLSVGHYVDVADLGEVPDNVEVHQWIPQKRVLSETAVFITHSGMGGTMEALSAGVPLVAVPQAGDQLINAARVAELGLGVHLPYDEASVQALRAAVAEADRDEVRQRVREMRREIREAGGASRAADVVEELAEERRRSTVA